MEKIGEAAEQEKYQHSTAFDIQVERTQSTELNKQKHFLEGTFCHNIRKEPTKKKTNSVIETKKSYGCSTKEKIRAKPSVKAHTPASKNRKSSYFQNLMKGELEEE